ncbi:hypothetical protein JCM3774_001053 [Rhodotorula dairenensis]
MSRRTKGDHVASPTEQAIIRRVGTSTLRQLNPDGSRPDIISAGKGWQGGVIAASGPANADQACVTRDDTLPRPTKPSVLDPTRLLKQVKAQQNAALKASSAATAPPSASGRSEPSPAPRGGGAASTSAPAPVPASSAASVVSKHAPRPAFVSTNASGPPVTAAAGASSAPPPPPVTRPRPPVENGSAWKDYIGDQPADNVQPISHWAQGRSDFAAKNKFKAPPIRSPGYAGTGTTTSDRAPLQKSQRSMPPSLMTNGAPPPSSLVAPPRTVAGSKVASLAQRSGDPQVPAGASRSGPAVTASKDEVATPKPIPRAKTGASNETHLSRWATPAPAAASAPSPSTTSKPTTRAAAPNPPTSGTSPSPAPVTVNPTVETKDVPHLTINGLASSRSDATSSTTTASSGTSTARLGSAASEAQKAAAATPTPPPTPPVLHTSTKTLPPPITSSPASVAVAAPATTQPSKTTAAFIAAATANSAASSEATPSAFKLNGAAVDFQMPTPTEYRKPDWVEKVSPIGSFDACWSGSDGVEIGNPQERANVDEMEQKLEKLSISTPGQKQRVQRDETRSTRSPRGTPRLPPADRARLASGGPQRTKKTPEEIEELMARMKLKNEETRKRVEAVERDRAAYESTQAEQHERASSLQRRIDEQQARAKTEEQAKRERTEALQKAINEERARTAAAKLAAKSGRAWDAGKGRAGSPTPAPAPAASYPSVEAEAREARRRAEEERERQTVVPTAAREISEEEAERIRRRDGVRGDDAGWETVVHHEGPGRAETVVR